MQGVVNAILLAVGLIHEPIAWLADPATAMLSIIAVDIWKSTPFMALLLLAGLQLIPPDIYEAAKLDSDSPFRTFVRITFPLLKPTLVIVVLFRALDAFRAFDLFYILNGNALDTEPLAVRKATADGVSRISPGIRSVGLTFLLIGSLTLST